MNGDGQMDLNEFSIACKLINLKLKGVDIPSVLPQQILVIPQVQAQPVSVAQPMMSMGMQMPMTSTMPMMSGAQMHMPSK